MVEPTKLGTVGLEKLRRGGSEGVVGHCWSIGVQWLKKAVKNVTRITRRVVVPKLTKWFRCTTVLPALRSSS